VLFKLLNLNYSIKFRSYDHWLTNKAYLSAIVVPNISRIFFMTVLHRPACLYCLQHRIYNLLGHAMYTRDRVTCVSWRRCSHLAAARSAGIISLQSYFYYWYSVIHSLFHSRLKSSLLCESSLPQPFLCLLQDSLYGFPRLFTATSEHIRLFTF